MFCLPYFAPIHDVIRYKNDPMHFWIDKRSDPCGYSSWQRVPANLSAGRRRRPSKPMVPVHRFQQNENRQRVPGRSTYSEPATLEPQPSVASISASADQIESGVYFDNVEHQLNMAPRQKRRKLKYYVLALLCIGIVVMTGIKYFYMQSQGFVDISLESSLTLLAAGLMVSCMLSGCRSKGANVQYMPEVSPTPHRQAVIETEEMPTTISERVEIIRVRRSTTIAEVEPHPVETEPEPPPPPYHLAILLPPNKTEVDEVPPPTYDKAVVR